MRPTNWSNKPVCYRALRFLRTIGPKCHKLLEVSKPTSTDSLEGLTFCHTTITRTNFKQVPCPTLHSTLPFSSTHSHLRLTPTFYFNKKLFNLNIIPQQIGLDYSLIDKGSLHKQPNLFPKVANILTNKSDPSTCLSDIFYISPTHIFLVDL